MPGGLFDDDSPPPPNPFGNKTIIDNTYIGENAAGHAPTPTPSLPAAAAAMGASTGDSLYVRDGGGADAVVVRDGTVVKGTVDLSNLGSGNKQVGIDDSTMDALYVATAGPPGTATVWLGGNNIGDSVYIALNPGSENNVYLQKEATNVAGVTQATATGANVFPDQIANPASVTIDGGFGGLNVLTYDSSDTPPSGTSDFFNGNLGVRVRQPSGLVDQS